MRRANKMAIALIIVIVVLAFFFAPVVFWFSTGPEYQAFPHPSLNITPVYRSLGCVIFGYGDTYAPDWFGLVLGCWPANF